jgi:putative acetyltransferase
VPHAVRPARADELDALTAIWRRAVEATHDFLAPGDVDVFEPQVRTTVLPAREVLVVDGPDGRPAGFAAVDGAPGGETQVDMLFVDPAAHGTGVGTALLDALAGRGALTVDVNEQNPAAHAFYRRRGFVEVGRSPRDGGGRPYPLVHLRLPA